MTRRNKIIIWTGILVGLLLAALLFYTYINNRGDSAPVPQNEQQQQEQITPTETPQPSAATVPAVQPPTPAPPTNPEDQYLKQLARIFVERVGSYSNQNDNSHINDVLPLATERMATYLESLRMEQSREYTGSTTRVITSALRERDVDSATVDVRVQQEVKSGGTSSRVYKTGYVLLERSAADWKISGVFWE